MVNSDKCKAARKGDLDVAKKRQQINNAQQKAFDKARHLKAVQNAAANAEDAVRLTEHEENMRAQKLKREAKAAKAAEFRARAEAAVDDAAGFDLVKPCSRTPRSSVWASHSADGLQVSRHVMQKNGANIVLTEEQLKSQVASLVSLRQAKVAPRSTRQVPSLPQQQPPSHEAENREELLLDGMLASLVKQGTLSEVQVDRLTDRIARGEVTVLQSLRALRLEFADRSRTAGPISPS